MIRVTLLASGTDSRGSPANAPAASGLLDADDPALAAQHLSALTFGQVNNASMMGTIQLSEAEADRIITTGIAAFLRAYAPPAR
jgi:hypothetical protein